MVPFTEREPTLQAKVELHSSSEVVVEVACTIFYNDSSMSP